MALSTHDVLYASRFKQGGRTVYSLDLSPLQLTALVPRPNPDVPVESNREIRPKHAEEFGDYFIENEAWVIPGIILRTTEPLKFVVDKDEHSTQFGELHLPRTASFEIYTLDGQHRTLGFFMARDKLAARREQAVEALHAAKRQYDGAEPVHSAEERLAGIDKVIKRFETERFAVQIYVEADPQAYRQMFYDIADNALGITAAVRARFDSRKVINRALPEIVEHPLLKGKLELESDRLPVDSPKFLSYKNVVEIAKNVIKGFYGRMSRNDNLTMQERHITEEVHTFLDSLARSFPQLKSLEIGNVTPEQLRETSLLASPRFLRLLAGVFHELRDPVKKARRPEQIEAFFKKLAPHASAEGGPVYEGTIWLEHMPEGCFTDGINDTSIHADQIANIYRTLLEWEVLGPDFLDAPPPPRPVEEADEDE